MLLHPLSTILLALAVAPRGVTIPAGTDLHVRLRAPLAASTAKANQHVDAVLTVPVVMGDQVIIPAGTLLGGSVRELKAPAKPEDRATVRLVFDKISSTKLDARLVGIDNARETIDEKGAITGILASETLSARIDQGINKVTQRYPGLGEVLNAIKSGFVKEANTDISYEAGTDMTLRLEKPLHWTAAAPQGKGVAAIEPAGALVSMVTRQPFRTLAERPPSPSDLTNLMFLGTAEQLQKAFHEAGWSAAAALNGESKLETLRAVIEMRGYKEAPVSILMLEDEPPDFVFQKQTNTFAQRHHLRIWRRPGSFQGRPIWVCAATHDISIDFSPESRTFIHRIDPNIDAERAKVVNDLLFTGRVTGLALVERSEVPTRTQNATGDNLVTDGRMAVLQF